MVHQYLLLLTGWFSFSACGIFTGGAGGENVFVSAPAAPPAELITSFPFQQLTGGVILIHGRVNHAPDTLNFILDTGSGGISLDSAVCAELDLPVVLSDHYIRGIGGTRRVSFTYDNTLVLPNLKADSLDFHINNYSFISSVYGIRIDGIIGYSFIKDFIIRIDYDQKKLYIYTQGRYSYETGGWLLHPGIRRIPTVSAMIRNKEAPVHTRYFFDLGAGLCLMLSNQFVTDSCLYCRPRQRRHKFIRTETQGFAGALMMTETVMEEVHLGPYHFHNVPTYLFDDVSNVTAYPFLGGLIGNDLLRRFNTTLNYSQHEIYLKPNSHFKEPFDYSYTGLTLYFVDGKIVVTKVLSGSPADRAGFREGDVVLAVGGNFSNDIGIYHELLKGAGKVVPVLLLRDGAPVRVRIKIKSIL